MVFCLAAIVGGRVHYLNIWIWLGNGKVFGITKNTVLISVINVHLVVAHKYWKYESRLSHWIPKASNISRQQWIEVSIITWIWLNSKSGRTTSLGYAISSGNFSAIHSHLEIRRGKNLNDNAIRFHKIKN